MTNCRSNVRVIRAIAVVASTINLSLCLVFFLLVPLLAWLNYGHGGGTTAWLPDWLMLGLLPTAYYLYWHLGLLFSLSAFAACMPWFQVAHSRQAMIMAIANGASVVAYGVLRLVLAALGIRPDSV